jgi:cardiolipin synthase
MGLPFDKLSIEKIYGTPFIEGNSVKLLYKGKDTFDAILKGIASAKYSICLELYIFRNDETGTDIAELLKEKASEGVRVYILYDHFGSFGTPGKFWDNLKSAGINIRASRPFKWLSPFHYAHRDHRKLIIIDGIEAFTGGLNIANEYRGFHLRFKKAGWRDTGIMLTGPIVQELFKTFHKAWLTWRGEPIDGQEASRLRRPAEVGGKGQKNEPNGLPAIPIFAASSKGRRRMRKLLYYSITHARKTILLTTAYFTPSRRMIDSLEGAVKRGVEVKLLVPGMSDVPAAHYAGRAFFKRLLRAGIKIYNYQGEVLHAKSYVFDGCWSIVGSANLDFQSLRWNDEGNVGILDEVFGRKMTEVFEEDTAHSVRIKEDTWVKRPLCERIKERFFVLFRRRL